MPPDYLGAEDVNVSNARSRLSFSSQLAGRTTPVPGLPTGGLSGTVRVAGLEIGDVGVYPTDDDPVSTDYLSLDPSRFQGQAGETVDVTVDGRVVGDVTFHPPSGHDETPMSSGEDLPVPDDEPETDPADAPGLVNADNPQEAALAPALRRRLGNIGGQTGTGVEFGRVTDADELLGGQSDGLSIGAVAVVIGLVAVVAGVLS